jgi:hypothetical protein
MTLLLVGSGSKPVDPVVNRERLLVGQRLVVIRARGGAVVGPRWIAGAVLVVRAGPGGGLCHE